MEPGEEKMLVYCRHCWLQKLIQPLVLTPVIQEQVFYGAVQPALVSPRKAERPVDKRETRETLKNDL